MWSSNKVFKGIKIIWPVHSRPFIRYQGKSLDLFWIWCCFQFFLHCLMQPNQFIHFLFNIILSQESDSESFKQSTCTFYPPEILLFKVFINACVSWEVKWQLIGAFSLVLDIQWIRCQYLQQIEIYLDHQYSASVSSKKLALHW